MSEPEGNGNPGQAVQAVPQDQPPVPAPAPDPPSPSPISDWAGRLTVLGAEAAYVALAVYLAWITFDAKAGETPGVSATISGATGALAAAFGVGYATVLGIQPAESVDRGLDLLSMGRVRRPLARAWSWIGNVFSLKRLLGAGVILYMLAGMLLGAAYVTNSSESPAVVRTIAIAFGGYVISYIGLAYKGYRG